MTTIVAIPKVLNGPVLRFVRRVDAPSDFDISAEPAGLVEDVYLEIHRLCVPSGREGPPHPVRPSWRDPYFTAWLGRVAYDERDRILYYESEPGFDRRSTE